MTMVDSIKVFVKSKEAFGWPDEPQDEPICRFPTSYAAAAETATVSSESSLKMVSTNADQSVQTCCVW